MSPTAIAIVSVVIFVVLMIAIKIVVGKLLQGKDRTSSQAFGKATRAKGTDSDE